MQAEIETGQAFWIVWRKNGEAPKHKHETFESAYEESKRLAGINPGATFYVLRAETSAFGSVQVTTANLIDKE